MVRMTALVVAVIIGKGDMVMMLLRSARWLGKMKLDAVASRQFSGEIF